MPSQTFSTLDEWQVWIDANIKTNGNQEITGDDGNITESAAVKFIKRSPLNWEKTAIVSAGGAVVASRPITVFMTTTPTSLTWGDNIYNEFVFINMTSNVIPLLGTLVYYNAFGTPIDEIPANQVVNIVKSSNDLWVQYNSVLPAPLSGLVPEPLDFIVSSTSIIPTGGTSLTITDYIGYNLLVVRTSSVQHTTTTGGVYYSWNKNSGLLTLLPNPDGAALVDEQILLMPVTGRGFVFQPSGDFLNPIVIQGSDFESDGVTYNDSRLVGQDIMMFVSGFNSEWQFEGTFFDLTSTGIIVTFPGFDAANFDNIIFQKIN